MAEFDWYTIEKMVNEDGVVVYGHGTYENSSVLAGQYKRCFLESFSTVEKAKKEYPDAEESGSTKHMSDDAISSFENSSPPSWFDPADAGEEW